LLENADSFELLLNDIEVKKFLFNLEIILRDDSDFFQRQENINLQKLITSIMKKEFASLKMSIVKSPHNLKEFDKINFIFKYFSKIYKNIEKIKLITKNKKLISNQKNKSLKKIDRVIKELNR
uniref:hypothetical protein n=1 Tax=Campylobacter sp. TaxID=205 RepID=UPI0025B8D2B0